LASLGAIWQCLKRDLIVMTWDIGHGLLASKGCRWISCNAQDSPLQQGSSSLFTVLRWEHLHQAKCGSCKLMPITEHQNPFPLALFQCAIQEFSSVELKDEAVRSESNLWSLDMWKLHQVHECTRRENGFLLKVPLVFLFLPWSLVKRGRLRVDKVLRSLLL
jgi:hypothetical protein